MTDSFEAERSSRQAWAEEAVRLEMAYAEAVQALQEEIAWQKHAYRDRIAMDETDRLGVARMTGMEDALRVITTMFESVGVIKGAT